MESCGLISTLTPKHDKPAQHEKAQEPPVWVEVKGCFRQPTDVCGSLELTSELLISPGDSKRSAKTVYFAYSRRWRRMSSAESKLNRSWQEIAAEASQEQDP